MRGDRKTADDVKSRLMKIRVQLLYQFRNGLRPDRRRAFITMIVSQYC